MIIPRILLEEYITSMNCVLTELKFECVVEVVLPNARSGRSVLKNGKRAKVHST